MLFTKLYNIKLFSFSTTQFHVSKVIYILLPKCPIKFQNFVCFFMQKISRYKIKRMALEIILWFEQYDLTLNGDQVATTSKKGINIRIFDTMKGQMLQEVRRGNQYDVSSLSFSRAGNKLLFTSNSNIIHVFVSNPCPGQVIFNTIRKRGDIRIQQSLQESKIKVVYFQKTLPFLDAQYDIKMVDFDVQTQSYVYFGFHDDNLILVIIDLSKDCFESSWRKFIKNKSVAILKD